MSKVELTGEYHADCNMLMRRLKEAEDARDRFRQVLEAAEYRNIDRISVMPLDDCKALGENVARMTKEAVRLSGFLG